MTTELVQQDTNSRFEGRRNFLLRGSIAALGALAGTLCSVPLVKGFSAAGAQAQPYFLQLMQQFATNVGFTLKQQAAEYYIQQAYGTRSDPWRQYQRPLDWSYSYQSAWGYYWSRQYSYTRPSYILYPWMKGHENGLVTFQSLAQRNYFANYLAGPTIWGLSRASLYVLKRGIISTNYEISRALLPNCECQSSSSQGRFQDSYRYPDSYTSFDGGRVTVDYQRVSSNEGQVQVEYRNPLNGDRDFDYVSPVPLS
jgi:hypothetical protein